MRYRHCRLLRCERENRVGEKSRGDDAHRRSRCRSGVLSIFEKKKRKEKKTNRATGAGTVRASQLDGSHIAQRSPLFLVSPLLT